MFRTAMSLEKGHKDKGEVVQNASDRQMNRETKESAGQDPASEQSPAAPTGQPSPDPLSHLPGAQPPPHTRPFVTPFHLTVEPPLPSSFLLCLHREACLGPQDLLPTLSGPAACPVPLPGVLSPCWFSSQEPRPLDRAPLFCPQARRGLRTAEGGGSWG